MGREINKGSTTELKSRVISCVQGMITVDTLKNSFVLVGEAKVFNKDFGKLYCVIHTAQ